MADQPGDGFDELDIDSAEDAIEYIQGNIEMEASEIQIIKKEGGGFKGRVKF